MASNTQVPLSDNTIGCFQDMGQGASSRLASWQAFTADPSPMLAPQTTAIVRGEDFTPMLDGISQGPNGGAMCGGDNAFLIDSQTGLLDNFGALITDNFGNPLLVGF